MRPAVVPITWPEIIVGLAGIPRVCEDEWSTPEYLWRPYLDKNISKSTMQIRNLMDFTF